MYTCGPTVWNYPHIGNYRTFLFEDLLRRFLEYRGYKVIQVMNITDVDDRIIKECREHSHDLREFTEKYERAFFEDLDFLGAEKAEYYPRATDNIPEIIQIIEGLLRKRIAYKSEDGSIYYSISKFPSYGKLSGIKPSELKAGARVSQDDYSKDSVEDFALWKAWDEKDGKIFWESSLGRGRPGWHIECSAMSMKFLGEEFDIHTGGVDLIFPHHENEIAQSEGFTGKKFANYWLHSEHLLINEQKMAKRLGNFITIREIRGRGIDGQTLRFFLLSGHYRAQVNFSEKSIDQAAASVKRINEFVSRLEETRSKSQSSGQHSDLDLQVLKLVEETRRGYVEALENDLDSPSALAKVFEFITEANRLLDKGQISFRAAVAMHEFINKDFNTIFGVILGHTSPSDLDEEEVTLLKEREEARKRKDWSEADSIRNKLSDMGIEVQDTPEGQRWRRRIRTLG